MSLEKLKSKWKALPFYQQAIAVAAALLLIGGLVSQCSAPVNAQTAESQWASEKVEQATATATAEQPSPYVGKKPMAGRGPEQGNLFSVDFQTPDGKRVGRGGQMSSLPPIGYVYIAATARRERGVSGYVGPRYRVVGGEFTDTSCSSTRCVSQATVFVAKE